MTSLGCGDTPLRLHKAVPLSRLTPYICEIFEMCIKRQEKEELMANTPKSDAHSADRRRFMQAFAAAGAVVGLAPSLVYANTDDSLLDESAGFDESFPEDEAPISFPDEGVEIDGVMTADEMDPPELDLPILGEGFEYGDDILAAEIIEMESAEDDAFDGLDMADMNRELAREQQRKIAIRRRELFAQRQKEMAEKRQVRR